MTERIPNLDLRAELERIRSTLIRQLVSLARSERRLDAEQTALQIEQANRMIETADDVRPAVGIGRAIDYVRHVLRREQHPIILDEMEATVMGLGFDARSPEPHRRANYKRCIGQYTSGIAGRRRKVIKVVNGKIGLGEWPDSMFEG